MTIRGTRFLALTGGLALATCGYAQTMTEFGAAAAAGTAGGVGGKGISDGLNKIFGKVDDQTKAAAKQEPPKKTTVTPVPAPAPAPTSSIASAPAPSSGASSAPASGPRPAPASKVARVVAEPRKQAKAEPPSVPDPPAPANHAAVMKAPPPPPPPAPVVEPVPVAPPPPPPPMVTADDLKNLKPGTSRADLLVMGSPTSQMTMFDDENRLLEIYSYAANGATFGVVRLNDGSVSKVELR